MAAAQKKNTHTAMEVAVLESKIQEQQAQIEELKRKLDHMNEVFLNSQRAQFGQSSEKPSYVMSEDQPCLFNEAEKEQDHKAEEPIEENFAVKAHARRRKCTLEEMTANLPEKESLLELPEDQRICGKCGGMFKPIGGKFVHHELQVIPPSGEAASLLNRDLCLRALRKGHRFCPHRQCEATRSSHEA